MGDLTGYSRPAVAFCVQGPRNLSTHPCAWLQITAGLRTSIHMSLTIRETSVYINSDAVLSWQVGWQHAGCGGLRAGRPSNRVCAGERARGDSGKVSTLRNLHMCLEHKTRLLAGVRALHLLGGGGGDGDGGGRLAAAAAVPPPTVRQPSLPPRAGSHLVGRNDTKAAMPSYAQLGCVAGLKPAAEAKAAVHEVALPGPRACGAGDRCKPLTLGSSVIEREHAAGRGMRST